MTSQLRRTPKSDKANWIDVGCSVSPRCTECPLPVCRFEVHGGILVLENIDRDAAIIAARSQGAKVRELQARFGLSKRTILRIQEKAS